MVTIAGRSRMLSCTWRRLRAIRQLNSAAKSSVSARALIRFISTLSYMSTLSRSYKNTKTKSTLTIIPSSAMIFMAAKSLDRTVTIWLITCRPFISRSLALMVPQLTLCHYLVGHTRSAKMEIALSRFWRDQQISSAPISLSTMPQLSTSQTSRSSFKQTLSPLLASVSALEIHVLQHLITPLQILQTIQLMTTRARMMVAWAVELSLVSSLAV